MHNHMPCLLGLFFLFSFSHVFIFSFIILHVCVLVRHFDRLQIHKETFFLVFFFFWKEGTGTRTYKILKKKPGTKTSFSLSFQCFPSTLLILLLLYSTLFSTTFIQFSIEKRKILDNKK